MRKAASHSDPVGDSLQKFEAEVQRRALSSPGSVIQMIRDMEALMTQEGFRESFCQAMASSGKPESQALGRMLEDPASLRESLPALMRRAGVRLVDVMNDACESMRAVAKAKASMEIAARAGEIVAATIQFAVSEKGGHQDRKALLQILGLTEKPVIANININSGMGQDLSGHGSFESIAKAGSTILLQN